MTEPSRYDQLSPVARALVDDYDTINLAEMLVSAQDQLAALCQVACGYCPHCGRGDAAPTVDDWEQQRQRAEQAEAERDEARATNQRLNYRAQQLESELAAYRRAVAQWEINDRSTYVPLRTIAAIAKAAGRDIETPRWLMHYQRVEQAEAALARVQALADQYPAGIDTAHIHAALDPEQP
jgi:hypothetical protein